MRIEARDIKAAAAGRWPEILAAVAGIEPELLDGRHHGCPRCGGSDRFRLVDRQCGAVLCNQCFRERNGDGIAAVGWMTGCSFRESLQKIADYLGFRSRPRKRLRLDLLEFRPYNRIAVARWCQQKPPISPAGIRLVHGQCAVYAGTHRVIALPIYGPKLTGGPVVGWVLMALDGSTLPAGRGSAKILTLAGSRAGLIGTVEGIAPGAEVWKTEGPTDALALLSADPGRIVVTGAFGAMERAGPLAEMLAECDVVVVPDADRPGIEGATYRIDRGGRKRPGWCPELAEHAARVRLVRLPYEIAEHHGRDLRDYLCDHSVSELDALAGQAETFSRDAAPSASEAVESPDDPFRLARICVDQYRQRHGHDLRYWRSEWWRWVGPCYRVLADEDLQWKLQIAIKDEFDRLAVEDKDNAGIARKVTGSLTTNVVRALRSLVGVPADVDQPIWIDDDQRRHRNLLAVANGILDLDQHPPIMEPLSPRWFSAVGLPYEYRAGAECPRWHRFLERNLAGDQQVIRFLAEWIGYCLTAGTRLQKFLLLQGAGRNGKGVFSAVLEAVLGSENVSHVGLDRIGEKFSLVQTYGKLANIAGDSGEIDRVAEGILKSWTGGDRMQFERKFKGAFSSTPTAKLIVATNQLPTIRDRSMGVWRRLILLPWTVQIPHHEVDPALTDARWWAEQGELPGILQWALEGRHRLGQRGYFEEPDICAEARRGYEIENNPARLFLHEHYRADPDGFAVVRAVYQQYKVWCSETGHSRPLAANKFAGEVYRHFGLDPKIARGRITVAGQRLWCYVGISEIQG